MSVIWYPVDGVWPGRLSVMPHPHGGDGLSEDLDALRGATVAVVVSLLCATECRTLGLADEAQACARAGLDYLALAIADFGVPDADTEADALIARIVAHIARGEHVAIHCRGGSGRTGMIASAVLVASGQAPDNAMRVVSAARGHRVPETARQREWVVRYAARQRSAPSSR